MLGIFVVRIAHYAAADLEAKIVTSYIPWPHEVILVSGVFEILGALGLRWHKTRRWAGVGLFVLTIAVTPANIYMLQAQQFPVPYWLLWLRLPLQVGLLLLHGGQRYLGQWRSMQINEVGPHSSVLV